MTPDTPQITVGLDVGYEAVRLVALEQTPDGPVVHRVGAQPLPRPRTPKSLFADPADVTAAIRTVFASYGDPAWPVVGGLRNRFATIVRTQVDKSADARAQYEWLMWEAAQAVIDPIEQYVVDVALTGHETVTTWDALIVAARQEPVESLFQLLQAAGITPVALNVATIALVNAFEAAYHLTYGETAALVHIEPGVLDAILIRDAVSNVAVVSLCSDVVGTQDDRAVTDSTLSALDSQFQALFNFLPPGESPDWIVVSGECDRLPDLCKRWADNLKRPVTPASPFQQMRAVPALAKTVSSDRWAPFMVATGLALRQMG